MSSQNNAESGAAAMVVAGIGIAFLFIGVIMAALLVVMVVVATIFAILAWRDEVTIGNITVTPDEAHGLVGCGVIGMVVIPVMLLIVDLFGLNVNWGWWHGYIIGGYVAGAATFLWSIDEKSSAPASPPVIREPAPPALPPAAPVPFRYASWDDEEPRP